VVAGAGNRPGDPAEEHLMAQWPAQRIRLAKRMAIWAGDGYARGQTDT
jgi:hypothetical protein